MDCTDIVIGFAKGSLGRVVDSYTRDRLTILIQTQKLSLYKCLGCKYFWSATIFSHNLRVCRFLKSKFLVDNIIYFRPAVDHYVLKIVFLPKIYICQINPASGWGVWRDGRFNCSACIWGRGDGRNRSYLQVYFLLHFYCRIKYTYSAE